MSDEEVIERIQERVDEVIAQAEDTQSFIDLTEHQDIVWQADTVAQVRKEYLEATIRTPDYKMEINIEERK